MSKKIILLGALGLGLGLCLGLARAEPPQEPQAPQASTPSMAVVRDPSTGQLRAATGPEIRAMKGPQPAQQGTGQPAPIKRRADGTLSAVPGGRGLSYSTVQRGSDGKLVERCVNGETAASHAAHGAMAAPVTKEPAHEQ